MSRNTQTSQRESSRREERGSSGPPRLNEYWINGEGIHRQVLQTEICKFLGADATSRPAEYEGRKGFKVKAIRPFTSEMIKDLQTMSAEYENEARAWKQRTREEIPYESSLTRKRNDPTIDEPRDSRDYRHGYPPQAGVVGAYSPYTPDPPHVHQPGYAQNQPYPPGYAPNQGYTPTDYAGSYTMAPPQGNIPAPADPRYPANDPRYANYTYTAQSPMGGQHPGAYYPPSNYEPPRGTRDEAPASYYPSAGPGRGRGEFDTPMGGMPEGGAYGPNVHRPPQPSPYDSGARDPYSQQQPRPQPSGRR